jgi:hypothetical protein
LARHLQDYRVDNVQPVIVRRFCQYTRRMWSWLLPTGFQRQTLPSSPHSRRLQYSIMPTHWQHCRSLVVHVRPGSTEPGNQSEGFKLVTQLASLMLCPRCAYAITAAQPMPCGAPEFNAKRLAVFFFFEWCSGCCVGRSNTQSPESSPVIFCKV